MWVEYTEKDKNRYKLSDEEHKLIFEDIKKGVFRRVQVVDQPTAVILGGQPRLWKVYFN